MNVGKKSEIQVSAKSNLNFLNELIEEKKRYEDEKRKISHQKYTDKLLEANDNETTKRKLLVKQKRKSNKEFQSNIIKKRKDEERKGTLKTEQANEEELLQRSRLELERKAKKYDQYAAGELEIKETEDDGILVDFTRKWAEEAPENETVEITDEFGRTRSVSIYETGNTLLSQKEEYKPEKPIYGDYMPSFEVDEEKVQKLWKEDEQQAVHYDSTKEVRNKGTAFYQFSFDEKEREEQLLSLKEIHAKVTQQQRKNTEDVLTLRDKKLEERRKFLERDYAIKLGERWMSEHFSNN
ncbi:MTREC associated protein Ctr1 [Schizosaccharomyces pombe]|uniref:Uncharacterized protein C140.04 n=1 Tax=Schizosaccharomyces pombe (strain 972 / ATCC 24843) TaxID=284812 RepID=YK24_SCHPO|nr:uncharacterized protein SPAC140.04 [Schizosaccharomyces pombe]Q9P7B7.1 RecName: Full=Uncharacterized protein C140.04 [Schizosaccharomyces pombe 972h-]CAB86415.1 conserved eukaryotic protein [Schizosaccharomyces pombe]|eukprot:NP_593533.1 uncharacterized protein SPAC140.04 [Schizosaccharomyces pombe]